MFDLSACTRELYRATVHALRDEGLLFEELGNKRFLARPATAEQEERVARRIRELRAEL